MQRNVSGSLLALVLFIAIHPEPVRVAHGQEVTLRRLRDKSEAWLFAALERELPLSADDNHINQIIADDLWNKIYYYDRSRAYATFVWNKDGADATLYMKGEGNSLPDYPNKVQGLARASFNITYVRNVMMENEVLRDRSRYLAVFLKPWLDKHGTPDRLRIGDYVRGALCTDCARDQLFPVDLDAVAVCIRERFAAQEPPFVAPAAVLVFGDFRDGTHLRHQLYAGGIYTVDCVVEHHERRAELTIAILPGA